MLLLLQLLSCVWLFCDLMDYSLPSFSIHAIFQVRFLGWVAFSSSRGSSLPRNWTRVSCIGRQILYCCYSTIGLCYMACLPLRKGNPEWTPPTCEPLEGARFSLKRLKVWEEFDARETPVGGFNMKGATWQGIQIASRSWQWPSTNSQQGNGGPSTTTMKIIEFG